MYENKDNVSGQRVYTFTVKDNDKIYKKTGYDVKKQNNIIVQYNNSVSRQCNIS